MGANVAMGREPGGKGRTRGGPVPIAGRHKAAGIPGAKSYEHPGPQSLLRPDVGTQGQFRKKKPPSAYRYDSSLSPAFAWDRQDCARWAVNRWGFLNRRERVGPPEVLL